MYFEIDQNKISFDDELTWDLISEGDTIGVFQLESRVGRRYAKEVQPRSIEELSDLIALIRPGCLQSRLSDDRSLTEHYIARKKGLEEVEYVHPLLEPILQNTYGIMCYQEQAIRIGIELAKMTPAQADLYLRYGIGKKKANLIAEAKDAFLKGCVYNNIPEKDVDLIFSWIEGCARYSFNKCLDPSSVVICEDEYKILDEIKIGDFVLGPTDKGDEFLEVIDVIDCGLQDVYEIELESGETLTCTLEHELLCSDGEKHKLKEILQLDLEVMVYEQ